MHPMTITAILDSCLLAFAAAYHASREGSPLRRARARLGERRFADAVSAAMKRRAEAEFLGDPARRLVELAVRGEGAMLSSAPAILEGTILDVIRVAEASPCLH